MTLGDAPQRRDSTALPPVAEAPVTAIDAARSVVVGHQRLAGGRRPARSSSRCAAEGRRRAVRPRRDRAAARLPSSPRLPRRRTSSAPWIQVADARLALAALAAAFFGQPERAARAGRHHRHERQDDDLVPAGLDLRSGRDAVRPHRHGRLSASAGREREAPRTTPEAPELQRMLREMVDRRLRRLRHGGVVARAGAAPRRLPALPRRDLHQPDPRSSRLPPRHGGLLPRQAAVVRAAAGGELRRLESRRSPRRRVCRRRAALGDLRHRRARRRAAGAAVVLARRSRLRGADAARHAVAALAAGRAAERLQRPRRRRDGDGARPAVQRDRTGHRRGSDSCRAAFSSCPRRPTTSASSSTTPTPTTPSRTCSRPRARSRRDG